MLSLKNWALMLFEMQPTSAYLNKVHYSKLSSRVEQK